MGYKLTGMYIGSQKVRPSGGGGWQPGANTVAYFPLDTDLLDHGPNHFTMTNYGGVTVDTTKISGRGVAYFNGSSMLYATSLSGLPTGTTPKTISIWVNKWGSTTYGIYFGIGAIYTGNNNKSFIINQLSGKFGFSTWGGGYDFPSSVTPTIGQRYNLVASYDGSTYTLYINGTANISGSLTADTTSDKICIGGNTDTRSGYWIPEKAYISEAIIENKARTAQEVSDYYDQTKANYGL